VSVHRVLVVDDSEVDRLLIRGLLEAAGGIAVTIATAPAEALEQLSASEFDLLVTDLVMPGMDGLALCAEVRARHPWLPIVLVTSQGSEEIAIRALRAGASSYVSKLLLAAHLPDVARPLLDAAAARRDRRQVLGALMEFRATFRLENDRRVFGPLVGYLQEVLAAVHSWEEGDLVQIGVALEEALVNAAEHGHLALDSALRDGDRPTYLRLAAERRTQDPYRERQVHLEATISRHEARFVVRDEGAGFDPTVLPDPRDPRNLLKPSGRGVLLMRTFMDEVRYASHGTEVTLIKRPRLPALAGTGTQ
jgi:CheY-like chemotaxis protein